MVPEIIIACDVQDDIQLDLLVKETYNISGVKGYKIGASLALFYGLKYLSSIILQYTDSKVLMYDHQKAGMDLPSTAEKFMRAVRMSGFDSVIIFPVCGNEAHTAWIDSTRNDGLTPIIGGKMTHWTLTDSHDIRGVSYYNNIYKHAEENGVKEFVVPATSLASVAIMKQLDGPDKIFYTPGVGSQGGTIASLKAMEPKLGRIIPIIGRSIYEAANMAQATKDFLSEMEGN